MMELCYSVYRVKSGSGALRVYLVKRLVYLFNSFF